MNCSALTAAIRAALLILVSTVTWAQTPAPPAVPGAQEALAPVRARFAPDKRLAVFDVTVERAGAGVTVRGEVEHADARAAAANALEGAGLGPVINAITVLPDAAMGPQRSGIVRVSVANVRGRAAHPAEMVTQTVMGWPVRILKHQGGWYYVHTEPDGYLGWIEEMQIVPVDDAALTSWTSGRRVIVTVPVSIVTAEPQPGALPVSDVVAGALLRATGQQGEWLSVELADGRRGYLPSAHAADLAVWSAARQPSAESIVRTAHLFVGVPYLWGGTSSKGLDCSGFTKTVFRLNGIELPRDTDQQAAKGTSVQLDDTMSHLRAGDLMFFGTKASGDRPERISHVAIYVGGGEFLHASGLVRRNSVFAASPIYSESLRGRLLRVQRVLPN